MKLHDKPAFGPAVFRDSGLPNSTLLRVCWGETMLPLAVGRDAPDVFWGPAHRLPMSLMRSIPTVVTIHDLVWRHQPETMRATRRYYDALAMRAALSRANRIVTVSNSTRDAVIREFPEFEDKTLVVYPGSLPKRDSTVCTPMKGITDYILFVGTLEPRKNLIRLLEAYAKLSFSLREKHKLVISGGKGWGNLNLSKIIDQLGINQHVIQLGFTTDSELAGLYEGAYVLAFPSLYEGFGFPIIEANTYGVPVLTSNVSAMPEIAGEAGVLVDPYDSNEISRGLSNLLTDIDTYQHLKHAATGNAARFDWRSTANGLIYNFSLAESSIEQ
jgi:glycosyltransferase involved in cell wall biosynthesis